MAVMERDLRSRLNRWVETIGLKNAEVFLQMAGISSSMAQKLARGKYETQPKPEFIKKIEIAMKKTA